MNCKHLTITPISRDLKSASNIDYHEQIVRVKTNELSWCWDDSRFNKAKANEYFAFYFHGIRIVIHKIKSVKPPSCRLSSWSKNVGQGDRNVLELTEPLKEIGWTEWQLLNGPESKMGTYTTGDLEQERPLLYEMLVKIETYLLPDNSIEDNLELEEAYLLNRLQEVQKMKKIKLLEQSKNDLREQMNALYNEMAKIDEEIMYLSAK